MLQVKKASAQLLPRVLGLAPSSQAGDSSAVQALMCCRSRRPMLKFLPPVLGLAPSRAGDSSAVQALVCCRSQIKKASAQAFAASLGSGSVVSS